MMIRAAAGAALMAVLGAPPAAATEGRSGPVGSVAVTMEPSSLAGVLGDRVVVRSTVVNTGAGRSDRLIAHLDVVSLRDDVYVDPEDWSSDRSVDVEPLDPGVRSTLEWTVRIVAAGEFDVYVVLLPGAPSATAATLAVGPATRLRVASRQPLDPGGALWVVGSVPLLLGALVVGGRSRRMRAARGPAEGPAER